MAPAYIMRARAHLTLIAVLQANASRLCGFTVYSAAECKSGDKSIPLEPPLELLESLNTNEAKTLATAFMLIFFFLNVNLE